MGLTVPEIIKAINEQNAIVPGGKFGAEPAPPGTEFTYTVRLPERFSTSEDFGKIVVRTKPDGSQVKLKDIATINLGVETYEAFTRLNNETCAVIGLYQAPGANAVELAQKIRDEMDILAKSFPESVKYEVTLDSTEAITAGINDIIETLVIALILVILVVFIFHTGLEGNANPHHSHPGFSDWSIYVLPLTRILHQCTFFIGTGTCHWYCGR